MRTSSGQEAGLRYAWISLLVVLVLVPAPASASLEQTIEVTIAKGDTLRSLCAAYLRDPKDWPEVARLNRLANPNMIVPGQVLVIPVRLAKTSPSEGKVSFLRGKAEILLPGSSDWKPLAPCDVIRQGSTVRTLAASSLEISFENGDSCFLRPETTLGMTETSREGETWIRRLFLQAGKIIARVQKATGTQTRFEVKTPSAQCAARGTLFRATADKDDMSRSEVLEGAVDVEAMGSRAGVGEGYGTAVKKGEAPRPPRPLLPGPLPARIESVYRKLPLALDFVAVPRAAFTFVELTRDRAGRETIAEAVLPPGQAFRIPEAPDGVYYLQARAIDDLGLEGLPSAPVEIRVRTEPKPPDLQGISKGARLRCGTPTIRWAPVGGADRYDLQLSGDPAFTALLDQAAVRATTWAPAALASGSYHLRARSVAADGFAGEWSGISSFAVLPPYPSPVLEKPKRESGRILLRWSDLGPGAFYRVHIARDEDFRVIVHEELAPGSELAIAPPAESGRYYARIRAFDAEGCESGFSNTETFRVGGFWATICTPCILAPIAVLVYLLAR